YQEGRRNIGANMPSVSEGKGSGTVYADYNSHGDSIDEMTKNAGIKNDVHQSVEHMFSENQQAHKDRQDSIHKQEDDVQNEHTRLKNHHNLEGNKFE
ncbi:conjugal transfer protein TraG, partial [Klebsiella pneumoniae]|nr:conjugal transfer protein TraG [Klebsiella pneumoniae]